jgi:hypothetical protein
VVSPIVFGFRDWLKMLFSKFQCCLSALWWSVFAGMTNFPKLLSESTGPDPVTKIDSDDVSQRGWRYIPPGAGCSNGLRQGDGGVAHDVGVFDFVAAFYFDLTQAGRVMYHHAATLPTAILEGFEGCLHPLVLAQFLSQNNGILDADAGP